MVFTPEQWEILESLRGQFGTSDSDIVRNVTLAWLSEKSFITDRAKRIISQRIEESKKRDAE